MKDRLIELLRDTFNYTKGVCIDFDEAVEINADYLLDNGVIVPPCKVGTHLWKITYPYRQEPKVTEFVVKNFQTVGKRHKIQIEVQAVNVPATSWMYYSAFYTTKEQAQQALRKEDEGK